MDINIRRATQKDIETLVEYRYRFALELAGEQPVELVQQISMQLRDYFSNSMSNGTSISFFAEHDNSIAGIGSMIIREQPGNFKNPSGRWGYIMNMYTIPEFRNQGVCKQILNELVAEGHRLGITAFELHATPQGERVYIKNGFEIHKEPTYRRFL